MTNYMKGQIAKGIRRNARKTVRNVGHVEKHLKTADTVYDAVHVGLLVAKVGAIVALKIATHI